MEKNNRVRKSRTQEMRDAELAGAVRKDDDSLLKQTAAETQTPLETRFIKAQTNLSSSRKRLLNQILEEPHETFFLSSREMARRYGVDSATIVRTVQAMGYPKFADFARDLRDHFVTQITPYAAMKAATAKKGSVADHVQQSLDQDIENLNHLKAGLDVKKVIDLAKQIHHARRIFIVGIDFAESLAKLFAYGLMRLGYDTEAPTGTTGVLQNKIKFLTKKDLLIAISFGQGLRETVEAAKRARENGVPTLGITDSEKTPIARFCDQYIIATNTRASFLDSYVAPVAAINAIIVACAHSQPKRSLEVLAENDEQDRGGTRWYQELEDNFGKAKKG